MVGHFRRTCLRQKSNEHLIFKFNDESVAEALTMGKEIFFSFVMHR